MSVNSAIQQIAAGVATSAAALLVGSDAKGHITGYPRLGWLSLVLLAAAIPLARRLRVSGNPTPTVVTETEPMIEATG